MHGADRFITSKKTIISYLGTKYGGEIKATLKNHTDFQPPEPVDPVTKFMYVNIKDADRKTAVKSAKDQITYK